MSNARATQAGVAFALFAVIAIMVTAPGWPEGPSATPLKHFEGSINHGRMTNDPVLSDLYVRASRALQAGDTGAAEGLYREAIAHAPGDPAGYAALGAVFFFKGDLKQARAEYGKALERDPDSDRACYGLGCVAFKEGRHVEARERLRRALDLQGDAAACHRVLGLSYDATGEAPQALFHFERAAELSAAFAADEHVQTRLRALRAATAPAER